MTTIRRLATAPRDRTPRVRTTSSLVIDRGDVSWMGRAACRDEDPELFFSDQKSMPDQRRVAEARSVCGWCSVRSQCLAYAVRTRSVGVWGGTTQDERALLPGVAS